MDPRDATEPAYEVRPVTIPRRSTVRPALAIGLAAVLIGFVVAKPWGWIGEPRTPAVAIAPTAESTPAARTDPTAAISAEAPIPTTPGWPAIAQAGDPLADPGERLPLTIGSLARRSGSWGVGDAGRGPRIEREEPWADWVPVKPEAATDAPIFIVLWPGTGICAGVPRLLDQPLFFAVTSSLDVPVDRRLDAWWTDGGRVASLDGSVHQITPVGDRGISYLVRNDGAAWPAGRYEFHVAGGGRAYAVTICIPAEG
jgi:hypothetical protein